ncbi:cation:proton antiporter [Dactylosporangium fulvum]|uniref:Sodium:proton antiporter n=1 Tax=Dactylosporangium fulvum TaxID=53359 RepID=A0ABY5VMR7_9ACTN|nr:sodium:proton antiporter [Dactylosporangium fulvum]UWP79008.1 sodium:proton antiporter [Dactylosporangium fulvum]
MNGVGFLLVVIGAVAVTAAAHRRGWPAALVVVVVASVVSFVPGMPRLELPAELILAVVLPPLLYSAALETSFVSFRRDLWPILSLGVGLVLFSAVAVGLYAFWLIPALMLGSAFILGAVLAPSDAVAAVALGRKLKLPSRLMTVLTGESLVNDAVALVTFQVAVAAVVGTRPVIGQPVLLALYATTVGVLVGLAAGLVVHHLRPRLRDAALETVLGALVPFVAYLAAEQLQASGVLAVVTAGFWVGHHSVGAAFATRLQSRQVWRTADLVLEAFVFAYMGLQVRFILRDATQEAAPVLLMASVGLVLLAVILIRPLWIFSALALAGRRSLWKYGVVLSWTGMRGVVTLAAAAGIPAMTAAGQPTPNRNLIQALALSVAVLTILLQGATLQPLVRSLHIENAAERRMADAALNRALQVARRAARQVTERAAASKDGAEAAAVELVERRVEHMLTAGPKRMDENEDMRGVLHQPTHELVQQILAQQRKALIRERDLGHLDDEVLRAVLQQLDYEEVAACTDLQTRL